MSTVSAVDLTPKPSTAVIAELEWLLERARSGQLRGFAIAAQWQEPGSPECTLVRKVGNVRVGPMVVALERIKLRLIGFVEDIDLGLEGSI